MITPSGWWLSHGKYVCKYPKVSNPERQGVWWSDAERWAMLAALYLGKSVTWVARRHRRSENGIAAQLDNCTVHGKYVLAQAVRIYRIKMLAEKEVRDVVSRSRDRSRVGCV